MEPWVVSCCLRSSASPHRTVAGFTGDVVDVGLVRFYMMELTGTGTELHPTGRVAVFANSVLFQAGTPLYKQMPGTEYAWHELTVKLKLDTDYRPATDAILNAVTSVYDGYRADRAAAQAGGRLDGNRARQTAD